MALLPGAARAFALRIPVINPQQFCDELVPLGRLNGFEKTRSAGRTRAIAMDPVKPTSVILVIKCVRA
jgi:hypothetical protein